MVACNLCPPKGLIEATAPGKFPRTPQELLVLTLEAAHLAMFWEEVLVNRRLPLSESELALKDWPVAEKRTSIRGHWFPCMLDGARADLHAPGSADNRQPQGRAVYLIGPRSTSISVKLTEIEACCICSFSRPNISVKKR